VENRSDSWLVPMALALIQFQESDNCKMSSATLIVASLSPVSWRLATTTMSSSKTHSRMRGAAGHLCAQPFHCFQAQYENGMRVRQQRGLVRTQSATSKPLESYLKCDRSRTRPSPADPYGTPVDAVLLLVDNRPYDIVLFGLQVCDLAGR
jgi:hypothetical protein